MNPIIGRSENPGPHSLLYDEWLVTNGLGGFGCGSIGNALMRKYHALLIATLPVPFGRTIMLNYVADSLILADKTEIPLSMLRTVDQKGSDEPRGLQEFYLDLGIPVWRYQFHDLILEKTLFLIHKQNTLHMSYKLISSPGPVEIKWRPFLHFRTNEQPVNSPMETYTVHAHENHYEIESPPYPMLRLYSESHPPFTIDTQVVENVFYEIESRRGYESVGSLSSPGYYQAPLAAGERIMFLASIEPWKKIHALSPLEALSIEKQRRKGILKAAGPFAKSNSTATKLALAADQFIMTPANRDEDMIRLQASGEEVCSIIAGFPWFTDWGRDTMISLEGLTLTTGRAILANSILRTFAYYVKDGLIPNMFPDGENKALYNTADATLWFFHAVDRYLEATGDFDILEFLLPKFKEIIHAHLRGTLFGIGVDKDGLLTQGQKGVQLTWMDAKVGDWVVTPRRGKAVEINGLWYNALRLYESWSGETLDVTSACYEAFNKRFWHEEGGHLYDLVDGEAGDDPAIRPNQLFAISLKYPVLEKSRWKSVLDVTHKELLTPFGLRTLSPSHPDFKAYYDGDLRARDAAYHQGTVWPWLIGHFIDVWFKVYPDKREEAHTFLKSLEVHLDNNCMGTIGEIFDASDPYHARGCFAQAWSVAEVLRSLVKVQPSHKDP